MQQTTRKKWRLSEEATINRWWHCSSSCCQELVGLSTAEASTFVHSNAGHKESVQHNSGIAVAAQLAMEWWHHKSLEKLTSSEPTSREKENCLRCSNEIQPSMGGSIAAAAVVKSAWIHQQLKQANVHSNAGHDKSVVAQWWQLLPCSDGLMASEKSKNAISSNVTAKMKIVWEATINGFLCATSSKECAIFIIVYIQSLLYSMVISLVVISSSVDLQ